MPTNGIEYIFSLTDKVSGSLIKITGKSEETIKVFNNLSESTKKFQKVSGDLGNSITTLKQKIDILQQERDLLPASSLANIRKYNQEINKLNKEVTRLETTSGGKMKGWAKDAFNNIPGAALLTNPLVLLGAGLTYSTKQSLDFEQAMAKVNATALMTKPELDDLGNKIKKIALDTGTGLDKAPDAFEKILSQTNDVNQSLAILPLALKASKSGFTDVGTVAAAVAQSMSAIGKNADPSAIVDTFVAAKRVGAGEFSDFATYIPNLITASKNLGYGYKDAAGMFAYMTASGDNAANAAMHLQNAYSALGKADIRDKMKKLGVSVFDGSGKIRSMVDIMKDMERVMQGKTPEQRAKMIEKMGLRDIQAKDAITMLYNNTDKLDKIMKETANSNGALNEVVEKTQTPLQKMQELWQNINQVFESVGEVVVAVLGPAINGLLSYIKNLREGNPVVIGISVAIIGLIAAMKIYSIITSFATISTGFLTSAFWVLTKAFYASPLGWIITGVVVLAGVVAYCWQKFEGFREVIMGIWGVIKQFASGLWDVVQGVHALVGMNFAQAGSHFASAVSKFTNLGGAFSSGKNEQKSKFNSDVAALVNKNLNSSPNAATNLLNSSQTAISANASTSGSGTGFDTEVKGSKNITINLKSLVEQLSINSATLKDGVTDMERQVQEALLRVLNSANTAAYG